MTKIINASIALFILLNSFQAHLFAYTVYATETSRGEYENGKYGYLNKGEFKFRFEIDEKAGTAKMTELVRLSTNKLLEYTSNYVITYTDEPSDFSDAFKVDKKKKGQRILCLVGNPGTLATETIMIGETFFEYIKASAGRYYLSSGTVQKSVNPYDSTL